ncbi:hypothetical protein BJ170DRAFT_682426 [Xylariales sp. AK1849]|nr:hypothetical protein BJ170DRAFT_682426 [Xylariales sp. AK1849]
MDKSSRTSNKKDKRVSFSEEIPVRQPPARSSSSNNNNNNNNNSRQESPAWFSSAGTASDPTIGTQAPGARHRVTDFTGGVSHDTIDSVNPGFGQRPQIHQTPSFGPPQIHHGPAPNVGFYINASTSDHQTGPCLLHNHNPHNPHLINGTQYTAHPHYHNPHQQVSSSFITPNMEYANGAMPNTGQHFQPPVPDTTYGPMVHTYRPRTDGGIPAAYGSQASNFGHLTMPCTCPYPIAPSPPATHQYQQVPIFHQQPQPVHNMSQMAQQAPFTCPIHASLSRLTIHRLKLAGRCITLRQTRPNWCTYPLTSASTHMFLHVASGIATAPMAMPMMQQPQYLQQPQSRQQPVMMHGGQPVQAMPAQGISVIMPAQGTATAMPVQGMMATHAVPVMGGGQPQVVAGNGIPGPNPSASLPPDIMGVGRTRSENMAEMLNKAHEENLFEPQDFKPADDSPSRMYMVRQLDNEWIKQTRYTIDHLPHRWYITPWGSFYAVRLEE